VELLGGLGDLLGLVADPFEVGDGLLHGADHAQVDRGGLALGDHLVAGFVELDLEEVDPVVVLDDLIDQQKIAAGEAFHGLHDLQFDHAAHLQHPRADAFEFGVKFLGSVLVHGESGASRLTSVAG
jgi:hypothetical protein